MKTLLWIFLISLNLSCDKTKAPSSPSSKDPIRIGEFGPLSGAEATFGRSTHKGTRLAVEEINRNGGIEGRPIELVVMDTKGETQRVQEVVDLLIKKEKVLALIGEISSNRSLTGAKIAQKAGIPMITPASTNPNVTRVGNFIFRVCFTDPFQGRVMAKFAAENLKLKRVAIMRERSSNYSQGLAKYFKEKFEALGGKVSTTQDYSKGDIDFKTQLLAIRASSVQAVFIPGYYTEVGYIARQARQLDVKVVLLGGDGWDSHKLYEFAKDAIHGNYFSNHFSSETNDPIVEGFIDRFRKRYHHVPDGSAALGYDAAKVLIAAIKRSVSRTPDDIRLELGKTREFLGITGQITIGPDRNAKKPAFVVQIDRKTNRFVTKIRP